MVHCKNCCTDSEQIRLLTKVSKQFPFPLKYMTTSLAPDQLTKCIEKNKIPLRFYQMSKREMSLTYFKYASKPSTRQKRIEMYEYP